MEARATLLSRFSQANVSDTRLALKAKLVEAQNFVRCIQDAYNSLSSALQLPNEIWVEIGWIVFKSCKETWSPEEPNGLLRGFLPLTHISHRLRSVIRSNPNYWTHVDLKSPTAKSMLQLSGNLNIRASYNRGYFEGMQPMYFEDQCEQASCYSNDDLVIHKSAARNLVDARERIEEILVVSNYQGMGNCVDQWGDCSFPRLHHLTLQVNESSEEYSRWGDPSVYMHDLSLSTLRLHGVYPDFKTPCYTALRYLTLSTYSDRTLMGMENLVHLLLQCKLLEELCLLNVVNALPSSSQPNSMPTKIQFDNLRLLSVAAGTQRVVHFITQLVQAPVLQHLHLHVESHGTHPVLLEDLVPSSHTFYHSIMQTKSLSIHHDDGAVTFLAPHNFPDPRNHASAEGSNFSFKIEYQTSFSQVPLSFDTLASFFGTNIACQTLVVELNHYENHWLDHTMEAWSTVLLPALPNLQKLSLLSDRDHPQSLRNVVKALTPQIAQTTLCASLQHVFLSASTNNFGRTVASSIGWPEVQLIENMVRSRHNAHVPLSSLRFDTNVLPEEPSFEALMKDLKAVVQDIEVVHPSEAKVVYGFMDILTDSEPE